MTLCESRASTLKALNRRTEHMICLISQLFHYKGIQLFFFFLSVLILIISDCTELYLLSKQGTSYD